MKRQIIHIDQEKCNVFSFLLHLQHTTARPFVRIGPETDEGGVFP